MLPAVRRKTNRLRLNASDQAPESDELDDETISGYRMPAVPYM
jgi:hypothetical protein